MVQLWKTFVLLMVIRESVSQEVKCYSKFDKNLGNCANLLGNVGMDDCCLNTHYGYTGDDGKCKSCGPPLWSEWTAWSSCSVPCKEGVMQRRRECHGQGKCAQTTDPMKLLQLTLETKPCFESDCCPEQGHWSEWGQWEPCSVTCEKGMRKRMRTCTKPPPKCGGSCDGPSEEKEPCVTGQVCPMHGGWSNWESWKACSGTCISGGLPKPTQQRNRLCTNPPPSSVPPGNQCPGLGNEIRDCVELPFCPVNGEWGSWGPASSCSVTCGVGVNEMLRECNNPAPAHGGQACLGSNRKTTICNTKMHCPVDGEWSQWAEWEKCTSSRGKINCRKIGGSQRRQRWCDHTAFDGKTCHGGISDYRPCFDIDFCNFNGKLSEWSEWSLCEPPCGEGSRRSREKKCTPDLSEYPEKIGYPVKTTAYFYGIPKVKCPETEPPTEIKQILACMNVPPCDRIS
ncbi:properdin [Esox lucius]|uniref:Properdin n=1 Tax=Esox lucius TaxID=8010 RepID=A0A3P8YDK5_ESOLU|nr:properdin [Esox lucius]